MPNEKIDNEVIVLYALKFYKNGIEQKLRTEEFDDETKEQMTIILEHTEYLIKVFEKRVGEKNETIK